MMSFQNNSNVGQISLAQPAQVFSAPWLIGSQQLYGGSLSHLQNLSVEQTPLTGASDQVQAAVNHRVRSGFSVEEKGVGYGDSAKFIIFSGKDSGKEQKNEQHSNTISIQSPSVFQGSFELGLGQSMVCSNYPYMDRCYGLYANYGSQAMHGQMLLPLNMKADGPIYVNAKQYHGILRRRKARAKAEMMNKVVKSRKPYLHESRHLHAMRRPRGCGGRFLNTKKDAKVQNANPDSSKRQRPVHRTTSPSSEILQSDSGNLNSGSSGSSVSGSEVTSMYSRGDNVNFRISNHLRPPIYHDPLSGCCDLLKV